MEIEISVDIDDDTLENINKVATALEVSVEQIIRDYVFHLANQQDGKVTL
jgi:hypothetical protein